MITGIGKVKGGMAQRSYALYFKSHDPKLISAAAVAMMNHAYHFDCDVPFVQNKSGSYECIEVESRRTAE